MKYLKKFENHQAYQAAESGLILPNVSLCVQENEVHYKPYDPYNGHEYVEIGGLKWATMNIGANSVTDAGLYFQWGDTQGYTADQVGVDKTFNWENYKYGNGTSSPGSTGMTKYNRTDGLTTLQPLDDAATAAWGGKWRMPTTAEFQALGAAVNTAFTTNYQGSGVSGYVLTDKVDNTKVLFLPACGYAYYNSAYNNLPSCYYYSSSVYDSSVNYAWFIELSNNIKSWQRLGLDRDYGMSIRPVAD